MKKLLFFIFFLPTTISFSQGNLQFNQVISETFSISGGVFNSLYNASNSLIVPPGKVWKIESISFSSSSPNSNYSPSIHLNVNGTIVLYNYGSQKNLNDTGGTLNTQPIWLKEGDVVGFSLRNRCATTCVQSVDGHISILEFNVTP
jgi:hypothetical protein